MTVRVKQKDLILIPQHHWSPTASHPPPLHPLLWPPAPPPLLPFAFCHHCFWKFSKNWKEEGDNMHPEHMVLRFKTQITYPQRPTEALHLTVNKTINDIMNVVHMLAHDVLLHDVMLLRDIARICYLSFHL